MVNFQILLAGFVASTLAILFAKILDKNPQPIFGVYQRANGLYWFKFCVIYAVLTIRKLRQKLIRRDLKDIDRLEQVQKLPATPLAVDAVYFNGANRNGDFLNLGTARRPNRLVDGFLYLRLRSLPELGLLEFPKLPDTSLFNEGPEESYEAGGIKVEPLEPFKKWRVTFSGHLREASNPRVSHQVSIDALYTSDEPIFNYEQDMVPSVMAKAIAYEKWSRSYFRNLKESHQLHYEQFGTLKADIRVDGRQFEIELVTARDHSVGAHRDWSSFRRYVLHWVSTENGDHFSIGTICQPITFSRMQIGFVYNAHDRKLYPVTKSDLELYQFGESGEPPKDYAFTFKAGKTDYAMKVRIIDAPFFYISKEWESKVYECLCTVEVNGIKGYGGVEWEYRNPEGRNVKQTTF